MHEFFSTRPKGGIRHGAGLHAIHCPGFAAAGHLCTGAEHPTGRGTSGQYGPNRLRGAPKPTLAQRFVQQLKDPMLLILLAAAVGVGHHQFCGGGKFRRSRHHPGGGAAQCHSGRGAGEQGRSGHRSTADHDGRHLQGDAGRTSDHPAQRRAGARGCGGTGSGGQRPGGRTPAGECQPQDRGGRPDGGECAGHQAGKTAVIAAPARPKCRWPTGRICAIWAPRWSTAGAGR